MRFKLVFEDLSQASRIWAWSAQGFEDLGLERARLRGFMPASASGFEDLGQERARLEGCGPEARQALRILAWSVSGFEDLD